MQGDKQVVEYSSMSKRLIAAALDLFFLIVIMTPIMNGAYALAFDGRTPNVIMREIQEQHPEEQSMPIGTVIEKLGDENFFRKYFAVQFLALVIMTGYTLVFWHKMSCTPGKWILGCRIVDYTTSDKPRFTQFIWRFIGYIVSGLPLGLGFIVAVFTKDSRAWHDKLSGTAVINVKHDFSAISRFRDRFRTGKP